MSDQAELRRMRELYSAETEDIPVEELIRRTREFTRRITNEDRQRLGLDLRATGHSRLLQITAPVLLQQFFAGDIDLDVELARRYANAPLLSHVRFTPRPGEPVRRQATALFATQDDAATMTVDAQLNAGQDGPICVTMTMFSTLSLRFDLAPLGEQERSRWLDLVRREDGIAFLWTRERWEQPYLIFVVREWFARLYAFSPAGFEAAVRLTPDMLVALRDWLGGVWFPDEYRAEEEEPAPVEQVDEIDRQATHMERPASLPPQDAPESDWDLPGGGAADEPPFQDEGDSLDADDLDW